MSQSQEPSLRSPLSSPRAEDRPADVSPKGVVFVASSTATARGKALAASGYVFASTARSNDQAADAPTRGRLREAVEGAIELALALRGALPAAVAEDGSPMDMARDQLFRIRTLGAKGLCVSVGELSKLADEEGVLDASDSELLRVWRRLSEAEPVSLMLDEEDRGVSLLAPLALDEWHVPVLELGVPRRSRWSEDARSHEEEDHDLATGSLEQFDVDEDEEDLDDDLPYLELGRRPRQGVGLDGMAPPNADRPTERDGLRSGAARNSRYHSERRGIHVMRHDPLAELDDPMAYEPVETATRVRLPSAPTKEASDRPARGSSPTAGRTPTGPKLGAERTSVGGRADDKRIIASERQDGLQHEFEFEAGRRRRASAGHDVTSLREHAATLSASRGSRPVKQIEQLFVERYSPLLEAVCAGYADREADRALSAWRASFEKSYQESFATIRLTGKRPRMVLDTPEEAVRLGRQSGARSVQLLLVDGMRFGLGERVQRRLSASLEDLGNCVERAVLWAALPSVTSVQMQLLAQGARGLREIEAPSERDLTAFRDGTACIPRRERIGQRDLLKLDVVEARMRDGGGDYERRMEELADEVAEAVVKVAEGLSPRTLLYVFGDHGFHLRATSPGRTGPAEQGGARPEEVLVPGYGWLIGPGA